MKSNFKKLPGSIVELEVTLTQDEFKPYWDGANERALNEVHLKGFRKGTAPREMADKVVDKDHVFEEAAREAIRWSLDDFTKENNWTIIDTPKIEVEDAKTGITYKASITVFPEVKLPDYKKIAKNVLAERKEIVVEQKEIDEALEWLRKSRSTKEKEMKLDDELAKALGKFENLEALKNNLAGGLKMEKEFKDVDRLRIKMLDEITTKSEIDTPEIMIQKTEERFAEQLGPILKAGGKSEAEEKKELRDRAIKNVNSNLVLYRIAEVEKIEYNPEQGLGSEKVFQFLEELGKK